MNPNYYRTVSPQPQSASSITQQREHVARAMYQNPYGATHNSLGSSGGGSGGGGGGGGHGASIEQMRSLQLGSQFGFAPAHPGAGQFFQTAPVGYHLVQSGDMGHGGGGQRSVSPARRRPAPMSEYHASERDRYLRAVSPPETRSPSGPSNSRLIQQQQQQQQRTVSPIRNSGHHSVHANSRYDARDSSSSSSASHDRHVAQQQQSGGGLLKKPRLNDTGSHYEAQEHYGGGGRGGGGGLIKQESRTMLPQQQQPEYVSRPMPLEAISPPATEENNECERMLAQVQDEIRNLDKIMGDSEMALHQWEAELKAAETRKEEYDKAQRSHAELAKPDSPEADVTGDVARRVISENRRISEAEHRAAAKKLHLVVPIPAVISNPMDFGDVMQALRELKKDRQAKQIRERYLKERYKQLSQAYMSRLEKTENNPKKKVREAKMRDYYERQFPEIKKMREDKIRDSRTGSRKGDETDGSGSANGTEESELEKYHRNAVLVPMLLDAKDRSRHFYDRNRLVENCANDYKLSITSCFWTQEEKDIFKEKYLQRPKDFGFICSFLKRKTVHDCVQHYYLTKRKEMYKQMIKKQKAIRIKRGPNKRLQSSDDPMSPTKLVGASMPIGGGMTAGSAMRLSFVSENRGEHEDVRAISLTIVCPAKKCHAKRRAVKRLFKAPFDFPNFSDFCRHLELPETAISCCKYCVSYLERRLGLKKWSTSEVDALKKGLIAHGANWNLIAKCVGTKRLRDCMQYYRRHSAELGGSAIAGSDVVVPPLSLPPLADDEYSPFSASSSDDDEPTVNGQNHTTDQVVKRTESVVMIRTVSEDSNATLSAEEGEDEPEPPISRFMTTLPRLSGVQSFTPNQLPPCESSSRSRVTSPYALSPEPGRAGTNGPACVRDLIHSAIEKNLDKDRQAILPHHVPDEFRRRMDSTRPQDRLMNPYQDRRSDMDALNVSRSIDDGHRGMNLLSARGIPSRGDLKSGNRHDGLPAASSPGRRDLSPHNLDDRNRLNTIRSPNTQQQQQQPLPQSYQYSVRPGLASEYAARLHEQQHVIDTRQFEGAGQLGMQPDPRFMQFYSPYVYLPQGMPLPQGFAPMQLSPEHLESLAAAGFGAQMGMPNVSQGNIQIRGPIPTPQRSIILGTGRPGPADDQLPPGGGGGGGGDERANRLQTLVANRGILRDAGSGVSGDKRSGGGGKPDIITIDDSRRGDGRGGQSPAQQQQQHQQHHPDIDMRFHPGNALHHHMSKQEAGGNESKELNPNLTAGSLIDVIITRQISSTTPRGGGGGGVGDQQQNPSHPPTPTPSQQQQQQSSRPTLLPPKREVITDLSSGGHKPFTLGEHIEQIIASDFSRKDSLLSPGGAAGGGGNGHLSAGMAMSMVGSGGIGGGGFQYAPRMDDGNWKRNRLRMDEPSGGQQQQQGAPPPSFPKPSTSSVASAVEYEPISPANSRDNSESGGEEDRSKPGADK
ncbi:putative Nuclear receptor corepressor 2 [Hypsibius exemplaris]|uniref:Nuclear receptor corepressor 2 n=1 Tax=Hypsibius exemplaris TaxID=2072580 RepID=A0A1W0WLX7_HYPEX|nr:putative Nuclear receptor corepressor 2 [Hypsibius exemplaris]